jgi:hypothetical protein
VCYFEVFSIFKELMNGKFPPYVVIDFELLFLKQSKRVFWNKIFYCNFHMGQPLAEKCAKCSKSANDLKKRM